MPAEQLDDDDLDDEDRAILADVKKKGYYHGRPKSEGVVAREPLKVEPVPSEPVPVNAGAGPVALGPQSLPASGSRRDFDAFQQKWDRFDDDAYVRELESSTCAAAPQPKNSGSGARMEVASVQARKGPMFESGMRVLAQWQGQWYPGEVVSLREGEAATWNVQCDADRKGEHAEVSNLAYEFVKGSRVVAEWQGEWLSGTIAELPAGDIQAFQVQCDVDAMGVVIPIVSGLSLKLEEHRFAKGSRVQVEWEGAWYGGAVFAMPKEGTPEWTVQCDADPKGQVTQVTSRHRIKPDSPQLASIAE